jgi:ketosteroid isomerase-like protein
MIALLADDPGVILVGTAPDEFVQGREEIISVVSEATARGFHLVPGSPLGYESGDTGWVVDHSHFSVNGLEVADRMTAVFTRTQNGWRLVHLHHSVGIPDDKLGVLDRT